MPLSPSPMTVATAVVSVPPAPPAPPPPGCVPGVLDVDSTNARLAAALTEIAMLREQLARVTSCANCARVASPHTGVAPVASATSRRAAEGDSTLDSSDPARVTSRDMSADAVPMETATARGDDTAGSREVLSHCSDISAHNATASRRTTAEDAATGTNCNAQTAVVGVAMTASVSHNMAATASAEKKDAASAPRVAGGVRKRGGRTRKERSSAKPKIPGQSRYWTPEEHKLFLEGLNRFGHKDLKSISELVGTRNMTQVRTHSQKYFMRLMREAKRQNPIAPSAVSSAAPESTQQGPGQTPGKEASPVAAAPSASAPEASAKPATEAVAPAPTSTSTVNDASSQAPTEAGMESDDGRAQNVEVRHDGAEDAVTGARAPEGDKYSVPSTCGMTLLCLVGQDTLPI